MHGVRWNTLLDKLEKRGISRTQLKRDWKLIPNWVSYFRIALSPVSMVLLLAVPHSDTARWWAFWLFVGLAASDWVDGMLARLRNRRWASAWGALIDPIGDKLLVAFTLVGVLGAYWDGRFGMFLCVLVWLILAREFIITAQIRVAFIGVARPTFLGKAKTAAQMTMLALLLFPVELLSGGLLAISMMVTLILTVTSWDEYYVLYVRQSHRVSPYAWWLRK